MPVPQQPRHTITIRRITELPPTAPGAGRLGRHYRHDSRSLAYAYTRTGERVPVVVLHPRTLPILDQGDVGSCTGNAITGALGTAPFWGSLKPGVQGTLGEPLAVQLYSAAEDLDGDGPYPPNDNGSTGTSVCQAAKNAGLIAGYQHVGDLAGLIDRLQDFPVIAGFNWYSSFDSPGKGAAISIARGAEIRGGHEVLIRGVDPGAELFDADNSWGTGWGDAGSFRIPFAVMARLLAEEGDVTAPVPVSLPAPVPVPNPPQPPPTPVVYPADLDFVRRMDPWSERPHSAHDAVHAYRGWKAARGITTAESGQLEPGAG